MLEECPNCKSKVLFVTDVCPGCQEDRRSSVARSGVPKRPLSVTVVSWVVILLFGAFGLVKACLLLLLPTFLSELETAQPSVSISGFLLLFEFVSSIAMLIIGAGMLRGDNSCRWVFVIWMGLALVISPFTVGFSLLVILGGIVPGIIVFVLFRKESANFFTRHSEERGH